MKVDDTPYTTLRKIQLMEEKSPLLTKIERNFYSKFSVYLKNPGKEAQTIERIATQIYLQREKKIMQAALSKARGGKPDLRNMLDIEEKLFDSTLNILTQSRKRFFSKD